MVGTVGGLALKDFVHDRKLFFCFIVALAAVLAPLEVLLGLKYGVIDTMRQQLIDNPHTREIISSGNRTFEHTFFDQLRARPDVVFVIPRTRSLAATMNLQREGTTSIVTTDLISTAPGDPLLTGKKIPSGPDGVVLSESAAEKLDVRPGDKLIGSVARSIGNARQVVRFPLTVLDVSKAFPRDGAFATLGFLEALEDYRDGRAVPALGWLGASATAPRVYAGFRLYARALKDVDSLSAMLRARGVDLHDHSDEIDFLLLLDRNLSVMFAIIAAIGSAGYLLSLGASLWANVERKRKALSVLRLLGFRSRSMAAFPLVQAALIALSGVVIANVIFVGVAYAINAYFSAGLFGNQPICRLTPTHAALMAGATLAGAVAAAALAGWRAGKVQPSEGLRDV